jgi:hypothetical protein
VNRDLVANTRHLVNEPCLPVDVYRIAILALDISTGKFNWARTLGPLDAWNTACLSDPSGNTSDVGTKCPRNVGEDADFGMAPSFVRGSDGTPNGKDVVVAGQKNENLYSFSVGIELGCCG